MWALDRAAVVLAPELLPPVVQALLVSAPREEHDRLMRRWRHLAGVTVLTSCGAGRHGRDLDITLAPEEARRLVDGLKIAGRVLFAAGARRIVAPTATSGSTPWRRPSRILTRSRRQHTSSGCRRHTRSAASPWAKTAADSVVGLDFRVHGMGNLYVCDGSVYVCDGSMLSLSPASDPQVTIMALARLGAEAIAHHGSPKPLRLTPIGSWSPAS